MVKVQGTLTKVASSMGVILNNDGKWLNPSNELKVRKEELVENFKAMEGSNVEIELNDKGYYTGIKVLSSFVVSNSPTAKDKLIIRQACMKSSCIVLANKDVSAKEIINLASELEKWVIRDE